MLSPRPSRIRRLRADRSGQRCRHRFAPRRAVPRIRRVVPTRRSRPGRDAVRWRLLRPFLGAGRAGRCVAGPRRRLRRPVAVHTAWTDQPEAAQGAQGARRSTYCWTENPLGLNGYYLVSRGEKTPWRLKLRSASFNNVAVLPELLRGCLIADMVAILGSTFFVVGDIDK